jgi:CubicO group peptidase (beta-lactamase class C family)
MRRMRPAAGIAMWFVAVFAAQEELAPVRQAARAEIAAGAIPGMALAVVHRGRVVLAEGFGTANVETGVPVSADTLFQIGSVGKMLTAAAVLETAADRGMRLEDGVGRVVSGLAPAIGALTLHQLLAQVSGLRDMPGEHGEQGDEAHDRFLTTLTDAHRILPPDEVFSYSNIGYSLAGLAAAKASGVSFAELMRDRVFAPLGMTRSTVRPVEAMTWPLAVGHRKSSGGGFSIVRPMAHDTRLWPAGYVFSTARDLARFAMALIAGGRVDGREVLRASTPQRMLTPQVSLPNLYDDGQYGYATFQFTMRGARVAEHAGSMPGFAALLRTVPAEQFAVVALANGETPPLKTVDAAMDALLSMSAPTPFVVDGAPTPVSPDEMTALVGRYENRGRFVIAIENGRLVLRQNDGPALAVSKVGEGRYIAAGPENRPRLRFRVWRAHGSRPAYLHFALWAFRKTD